MTEACNVYNNLTEFIMRNYSCMTLINDKNWCPSNNCVPTFSRDLGTFSSEDIEMRVCRDEGSEDEDIILDTVEIYVH